jgi:hypothetical protein
MNEYEQFAKAFRCSLPMAESIVTRIRQRMGRDVPIGEILAAIRKIAPTRLTTDEIVKRLKKASSAHTNRVAHNDEDDIGLEPDAGADTEQAMASAPTAIKPRRTSSARRATSAQGQIREILERNWERANDAGLKPPDMTADRFVRATQSAVGEPRPTVVRILSAVQKLSKQDVLITPNLVADEIIEADELR